MYATLVPEIKMDQETAARIHELYKKGDLSLTIWYRFRAIGHLERDYAFVRIIFEVDVLHFEYSSFLRGTTE